MEVAEHRRGFRQPEDGHDFPDQPLFPDDAPVGEQGEATGRVQVVHSPARSIDPANLDLPVKNPNGGEEITHRSPEESIDEIAALDAESAEVLANAKALL